MKKKFALLLVLLFIISACVFSLAACDKEPDDFEKYELYRYLTDYRFVALRFMKRTGRLTKIAGITTQVCSRMDIRAAMTT